MGLLADFGAGFFADQAQQIAQRRELSVQEAIFEKRRKLQLEDEERRAMRQTTARADELNATRQPFQRGGLLFDRKFDVSPEGRLTTTDQELGPAPVVPDGPTFTRYDGKNRFTSQLMSDGSFRDLGAGSPVRQSEGGSSGGQKLTAVSNSDGSKFLYNEAGELVRELPAKQGKEKVSSADRKATLEFMKVVDNSRSVTEVKDVLRANGIDPNSREVINLPLGDDGDYLTSLKMYAKDALSKPVSDAEPKAKQQESTQQKQPAPKPKTVDRQQAIEQARAAIAAGAPRDAVLARLREMGVEANL